MFRLHPRASAWYPMSELRAPACGMSEGDAVQLLTSAEAAAYLTISKRTVEDLARSGALPCVMLGAGKLRRFHLADLDAFVARCAQ